MDTMGDFIFGTFLFLFLALSACTFIFVYKKMLYDKSQVEMDPYVDAVTMQLGLAWQNMEKKEAPEKKDFIASARFSIQRNGKLTQIEITEPSGWDEMDKIVCELIASNSPVKRIPKEYPYHTIEVEMSFHYT